MAVAMANLHLEPFLPLHHNPSPMRSSRGRFTAQGESGHTDALYLNFPSSRLHLHPHSNLQTRPSDPTSLPAANSRRLCSWLKPSLSTTTPCTFTLQAQCFFHTVSILTATSKPRPTFYPTAPPAQGGQARAGWITVNPHVAAQIVAIRSVYMLSSQDPFPPRLTSLQSQRLPTERSR